MTSDPAPATDAVVASEGWGVLHLFLAVDHAAADKLSPDAAQSFVATLSTLQERVQLHAFSVPGHKADIMLMALHEDLGQLRQIQTDIVGGPASSALRLTWSYISLTEGSEYTPTADQYRQELAAKGAEGPELDRRVDEFAERMAKYTEDKLHPQMPSWPVACFYPMSHRREGSDNWYSLSFDERKRLMHEHGRSGRAYTGRVVQLVAGSTGLDDWEWGVTLFAHDVADLKRIVYQLRYDEASARFAEFGPFVLGIRREPLALAIEVGLLRQ
ncbi:MAG: chlorite dismutase family protein [Nitriliruptoraceae bacterium]